MALHVVTPESFIPARELEVTTPVKNVDFSGCRLILGGNGYAAGTGPVLDSADGGKIGEICTILGVNGGNPVFVPYF